MRRVYWDLETTGFLPKARIVTIGWSCGGQKVELVAIPVVPIDPTASAIHGWTDERVRSCGGEPIEVVLSRFVEALRGDDEVLLCAHNGKSFDTHVLRGELERTGIALPPNVAGFVDTMHWCRKVGMRECSLDALARNVLHKEARELHSAAEDAALLEEVVAAMPSEGKVALEDMAETVDAFEQRTTKAAVRGFLDALVDRVA